MDFQTFVNGVGGWMGLGMGLLVLCNSFSTGSFRNDIMLVFLSPIVMVGCINSVFVGFGYILSFIMNVYKCMLVPDVQVFAVLLGMMSVVIAGVLYTMQNMDKIYTVNNNEDEDEDEDIEIDDVENDTENVETHDEENDTENVETHDEENDTENVETHDFQYENLPEKDSVDMKDSSESKEDTIEDVTMEEDEDEDEDEDDVNSVDEVRSFPSDVSQFKNEFMKHIYKRMYGEVLGKQTMTA